mmetsp:Transcript_159477/g.511713  ORF Transcript_159477/g.511713 Transcript_159477/m.511713 type:complete len:307 (-) Transcript_159477:22-942(-)
MAASSACRWCMSSPALSSSTKCLRPPTSASACGRPGAARPATSRAPSRPRLRHDRGGRQLAGQAGEGWRRNRKARGIGRVFRRQAHSNAVQPLRPRPGRLPCRVPGILGPRLAAHPAPAAGRRGYRAPRHVGLRGRGAAARGGAQPVQCIDAFAAQHARCYTSVNAVPILCLERARAAARVLASRPPPSPLPPGYLHGLPVVVKDLSAVAGVPFVRGSPIHADDIAEESSALVLALEAKGAIVVGKSNVPEYGAGSQTFNPVFGATLNPFDVRRSAGGSSGGAAAALASGTACFCFVASRYVGRGR